MRMSSRMRSQCWIGLTLGLLAVVTGCGESAPPVQIPATITEKKFVGTWVENRDQEASPYFKPSEDPDFRMIELKDDGTFKYYMSDDAGKPKGDAVVEGTWAISGPIVKLAVSKNSLPSDRQKDETPAMVAKVYPMEDAGGKYAVINAGSDTLMRYYRAVK